MNRCVKKNIKNKRHVGIYYPSKYITILKGHGSLGDQWGDLNLILRSQRKIEAICRGNSIFLDFTEATNFGHSSLQRVSLGSHQSM